MSTNFYTNYSSKKFPKQLLTSLVCGINRLTLLESTAVFSHNGFNGGFDNLIFLSSKNQPVDINNIDINARQWVCGYISYDYKNDIENLYSKNNDCIGFEPYHFFIPELVVGFNDDTFEILHSSNETLEQQFLSAVNEERALQEKLFAKPEIKSRITKPEYLQAVSELQNHIKRGDIYEVNFCHEFYAENTELNPAMLYLDLITVSPTPFSVFLKHGNRYLLSASPERFLKKSGDKLISQPIKGTIKRNVQNKQEDEILKKNLQNNPKERSENIMIVDLVRNDLSRIARRNSVNVEELCEIYTFPQVHQMISTVSCRLKSNVSFKDIIHATFPMGSMTGAPKIRAMELIEKYENTRRGLYSGAVGYITPDGDFDFNVVIRSLLYNQKKHYLSFMVGGAITFLSDPEQEYNETLLKASAMLKVLQDD